MITHLIVERQEAYGPYLVRRFMRIYPLFVITCALGAVTLPLYITGMKNAPWDTSSYFADMLASQHKYLSLPLIANGPMLHGSSLIASCHSLQVPFWTGLELSV